jgi:hypothetical protein
VARGGRKSNKGSKSERCHKWWFSLHYAGKPAIRVPGQLRNETHRFRVRGALHCPHALQQQLPEV